MLVVATVGYWHSIEYTAGRSDRLYSSTVIFFTASSGKFLNFQSCFLALETRETLETALETLEILEIRETSS